MTLVATLQKIIMYIVSVPAIILIMRQWIRLVVKTNFSFVICIIKIVTFPLYPAAAILLCYCISELIAIIVLVAIFIGILILFGRCGQAMTNAEMADEIDRTDNWIAMEYADEKVLNILAKNPLGQYKLGTEMMAKQIIKERNENS